MRLLAPRSLYLALLACLVASLWLSRAGVSLALGGLALHMLLTGSWADRVRRLRRQLWVWPCLVFYAVYVLGMLHTHDRAAGMDSLLVKVPLLLLPLVLGSCPALTAREFRLLREVYFGAGLLTCLLALGGAVWEAGQTGDWVYAQFSYAPLAGQVGLHPTLMGMLLNGAALLLLLPGAPWRLGPRPSRSLRLLALAGILLMEVLLASRLQLPLFLLGGMGALALWAWSPGRRRYAWPLAALGLLLGLGLVLASPRASTRLIELTQWDIAQIPVDELPHHGVAVRVYLWGRAAEGIVKAPWSGYGTGDAQAALQGFFARDGFPRPQMNAHNQYLQTALETGLPGLALWLGCLATFLWLAYQRRDALLGGMVLLFAASCLGESMLDRQLETVFFALFASLLATLPGRGTRSYRRLGQAFSPPGDTGLAGKRESAP